MLATVELQVRATTFARSILAALRRTPRCLPPASSGLQLQRVRMNNAALRNTKTASFQKWRDMSGHNQGLGWEYIQGRQVQLAIDVTLDIARTATIAATPNALVAAELSANATIVFDVDAEGSTSPGHIELVYRIDDIVLTALPPAANLTPQWVKDELTARLGLTPFKLDLGGSIPAGAHFANAGIAMDPSGTVLAVRAELSAHPALVNRWQAFHNGNILDQLGNHDWAVVALAQQLEYTLGNKVYDALRGAMKGEKDRLVSVDATYVAMPGRAVFILTPYFKVPVLGNTGAPVSVALSIDTQAGTLIIDIDAYGIRDLVDSIVGPISTILSIFVPVAGPFVSAALNDTVDTAMHDFSTMAVTELQSAFGQIPGAAKSATLQELPGEPFRYRATLPLPAPPLTQARIEELITSPDRFALTGSWTTVLLTEGDLQPDPSEFGWQAPRVACGAPGEAVLHDIEANPKKYAWLLSRLELEATGTAPVGLCTVTALSAPDPSAGVQITWSATTLPTHVDVVAPASLADLNLAAPIELEVRTTIGVLRVRIPPPPPLTEADVKRLRSGVRMQLQVCDAIVKPAWFDGVDHFDLAWIVDPLIDPDRRDRQLELIHVEVSGLRRDSTVVLSDARESALGQALAGPDGVARLQVAWQQGSPVPRAMLKLGGNLGPAARDTAHGGVAVTRQRIEHKSGLRVSSRARRVVTLRGSGPARFLALQDEGVFAVDAGDPGRPYISRHWPVPGVRGIVPVRRSGFAYGDAGVFWFDGFEAGARPERLVRAVVADASAGWGYVALLMPGGVEIWNEHGAPLARLDDVPGARAVLASGSQLLVASPSELTVFDMRDPAAPHRMDLVRELHGTRLAESGLDDAIYLETRDRTFVQLGRGEAGWAAVAEFPSVPWVVRVARSGRTLLHLGNGYGLNVLQLGPRESVSPEEHATPTRKTGRP